MRKNSLILCCFVCAAGAFGTFFRWLQTQVVFDTETGLVNSNILNVFVPLMIIAAAVLFYKLLKNMLKKYDPPTEMYDTFRGTTIVYPVVVWIIAVIVVLGGLVTLINTRFDAAGGLYTLLALMAILSGISFPLICTAARSRYSPGLVSLLMTFPIAMSSVWLITSYKTYASDPNTWVYAIEILALSASIVAFYYDAGYAYGKPRPFASMLSSAFAAFLCFMTLADSRYTGLQILFLGSIGMLMMYTWMIVSNMKEKAPVEEADEPEAAPLETDEDDVAEEDGDEEILTAGESETDYEPTREAPSDLKAVNHEKTDEVDKIIKEWHSSK